MCPTAAAVALAFVFAPFNALAADLEADLEAELAAFPPRDVTETEIKFAGRHTRYILKAMDSMHSLNPQYYWLKCYQEYVMQAWQLSALSEKS